MKISIKYYKELSLITGIVVAVMALVLYWVDASGITFTSNASLPNNIDTSSFVYHFKSFWEILANL